jgi:EpsI family protein
MVLPVMWTIPNSAAVQAAACNPRALFELQALFEKAAAPSDWRPVYGTAPDFQEQGQVAARLGPVDIYVAYYRRQSPGHELVAWENKPYDGTRWGLHETLPGPGNLAWEMPQPDAVRLRNAASDRRLVWTWFWVDGHFTGNPLVAKMRQALAALDGDTGSGALILSVAENFDPASAEPRLRAALRAMGNPAAFMRRAAEAACSAPGSDALAQGHAAAS